MQDRWLQHEGTWIKNEKYANKQTQMNKRNLKAQLRPQSRSNKKAQMLAPKVLIVSVQKS